MCNVLDSGKLSIYYDKANWRIIFTVRAEGSATATLSVALGTKMENTTENEGSEGNKLRECFQGSWF